MCRHFAYLGPPVPLHALLFAPPHGLVRQSYEPRHQRHGLLNADGFGVGWYPCGAETPARYRRSVPIWGDENLVELARVTSSGAILAAVRSATAGHPVQEGASAPFAAGRWLFSHNGALPGWPESAAPLAASLSFAALARQHTLTDSTLLWALLLDRLERGEDPAAATAAVTASARALTGGRVNLLLHDGQRIVATTAGDTLCYLQGAHPGPDGRPVPGVIVASEPFDDSDGWVDVPPDHLLVATAEAVDLRPHASLTAPTPR
jgi:glutamine amidotransferase